MDDPGARREGVLTCPMTAMYRSTFFLLAVLGLLAIAIGVVGLLDLPVDFLRDEATTGPELWIAIAVGAWMELFAWTALAHARLGVSPEGVTWLRFGFWCGIRRVPLAEIRRFGTGEEKHGYQRYHVLLLELASGGRASIKVSMYAGWREAVRLLGEHLERSPADTEGSWKGARFADPEG